MHWTTYLQRNKHPLQTQYYQFKELKPFCGKNRIESGKDRIRPLRNCNDEMQQLFACLKKWEYDNTHCKDIVLALERCNQENLEYMNEQQERIKNVGRENMQYVATEDYKIPRRLTVAETNQLFKKFPQPDLGMPPYNPHRRLPHMSYGDDQFGRKKQKGWKS